MPIISLIKKIIPRNFLEKMRPAYHFVFAYLAAFFYGFPSNKLVVIGITGTSGKTSSVYLMATALNSAGYKTGYTSTAMFSDGSQEWLNDKKMTMLGRFFTQKMLSKMVKNACVYAIVETTSEGIRQFRHRFINYDIVFFTSLYPEHIESHGSFENYKKAKGNLFSHLKKCSSKYIDQEKKVVKIKNNLSKINFSKLRKTIVVNGDDEHASFFSNFWSEEKMAYYHGQFLDTDFLSIFYDNVEIINNKILFDIFFKQKLSGEEQLVSKKIELSLLGEFNVINSLPLLSLALNQELDLDLIVGELKKIKNIPGRIEMVDAGQDFLAIVDYAYEPVALGKLYKTIDLIRKNNQDGKFIHILGSAGGGRDKSRRSVLGEMAGNKADFVIVSNEDPYDENPLDIINQVASGAKSAGKIEGESLFRILDRREAIKKALSLVSNKNDLVLITGKGSEQAICLKNGQKEFWDDRLVLREEIINYKKK
ncbi:MAG: UDP-N-acetylmuramyl-tripeptide synthetase [Patescibacteria group bacterium]